MIDAKGFKEKDLFNKKSLSKKGIFMFCAIAAAFIIVAILGMVFEYIEIKEIGMQYTSIFFKNLKIRLVIHGILFFVIFAVFFLSILFIRRALILLNIERGWLDKLGTSALISGILAIIISCFSVSGICENFLLFSEAQWFGIEDPVFGKDIGYFVFQRPFLLSLLKNVFGIWIALTGFVAVCYWFLGIVFGGYSGKEFFMFKRIFVHNLVNLSILLLFYAISFVFKSEDLLYGKFGELQGAGYTAKTIWLNYYKAVPFLIGVIAVVSLVLLGKGKNKAALKTALVFPASFVVALVTALIVQGVFVSPNEVIKEKENIATNITYTQIAYGLDDIKEVVYDVENDLTSEDVAKHKNVADNIRVVDLSANLTALNQIQGIRNYYKFNETDIVPYVINGEKTAVAITPREITKENLSDTADTYINNTLRYTHGFGVVMNSINDVTAQGQPKLLIKDIPPKSAENIGEITQPRIYYGELTNDYVVVGNEKYKELDYSEDQEDVEFSYDGKGGVRLTPLNRVLFAARYGDIRLLISDLVSSDSKILINRNIIQRLKTVAPFFEYDPDPYMVIDGEGRLKWIVDAYTTTEYFPYSQSSGEFNYIRNSVKAVVDAYDGTVLFYATDDDPIARCYKAIYPDLFVEDEFPFDLRENVKYPEYLFDIQSRVFGKYHISNPTTFYNKNDTWVIAKEKYGTSTDEVEIKPYYNMMQLEDEEEEELLMSIPLTLANKDNMVAWFAVRNEWDNYGKLQVYKFPKDINIYGPLQVENRINADMSISKELNLWSQGGSKVIRGNMIVVPIENSVLYVEPIYISSNNETTLPELKQVVVAYDEKIVMKGTLSEALYALFGERVPETGLNTAPETGHDATENESPAETTPSYETAARRVIEEFENVKNANAQSDWTKFGQSMESLEKSVEELKKSLTD